MANRPGSESQCADENYVVRHHLTTPFFVRMALRDNLISSIYREDRCVDPMLGPFDAVATTFARVPQTELAPFPQLGMSANKRSAITVPPGVFAPSCTNHDTINEDSEVCDVTITPNGGAASRLLDVFDAWRSGRMPTAVLSDPRSNRTVCPP